MSSLQEPHDVPCEPWVESFDLSESLGVPVQPERCVERLHEPREFLGSCGQSVHGLEGVCEVVVPVGSFSGQLVVDGEHPVPQADAGGTFVDQSLLEQPVVGQSGVHFCGDGFGPCFPSGVESVVSVGEVWFAAPGCEVGGFFDAVSSDGVYEGFVELEVVSSDVFPVHVSAVVCFDGVPALSELDQWFDVQV